MVMKALRKISLLLVSLLVISSGVLLPSLPVITAEYASVNPTLVELLSTLPSLFTMVTVLFSPVLAQKIGYKRTVQLGLLVTAVSGFLPMLTSSFVLLFVSRVTFGIGVGLFNPLLFSFSSQLYEGEELSSMIGFQSAFEGMGGILTSLLVAQLVAGGWRHTLWTYLIILPIFVCFSLFVPDITPVNDQPRKKGQKVSLDWYFLGLVALLMVLITVYMSVSLKLTALLLEQGYGTATDASNALALMGVGAMLAGLLFGCHVRIFKEWLLPVAFSGLSLSLFILANSQSVLPMMVINFFIGLCFRTFMPYLLNLANQVKDGSGERRTSLLLIGFNIGSAMTPVTIKMLENMLNLRQIKDIYLVESALVALIVVATLALVIASKWKEKNG